MDILNFIYWIRNRRVVTTAPDDALIPIGIPDERRDDKYLTCAIKVSDLGTGGGGSTTGQYRLSQFPDTIIPKTDFDPSSVGKAFDLGIGFIGTEYMFELENGTLVEASYCQSILESGIYIYECYEILDPMVIIDISIVTGWWVAFKQDPANPEKLIKVGELKMTQQFWDNWYDYTAKDSGPNVVKFITPTRPDSSSANLESYITKLTWTGSALVAEDIFFDFNGATALSLYNSLTGYILSGDIVWATRVPEYILDDDYYGLAMGTEAGWFWYRDRVGLSGPGSDWFLVGYNILTGETKAINIVPLLPSITNFIKDPSILYSSCPQDWINHPNGITVTLNDGKIADNGDNLNGIPALWSPYWENNSLCLHVIIRDQISGVYINTSSGLFRDYYWDNKAFYFTTNCANGYDQVYIIHKYHTDTKETTSYTVPYIADIRLGNQEIGSTFLQSWANNDGIFYNPYTMDTKASFATQVYQYLKHEDSQVYKFHLDTSYPSHAIGDKVYQINTYASYILDTLGLAISTYKNMKF
jgi:hypothetical protein